ncbi:MAG: hypothetical protein VXW32_15345, partial [Myxococcota bacterium]|nr:hypothetical protein [Myxococcota bacterium]
MHSSTPLWLAGLAACSGPFHSDSPVLEVSVEVETLLSLGFPAEADLAILLDTQDAPVVQASDRMGDGQTVLPESWLETVSKAFSTTDVEDALDLENRFEEWRLVSARISPCSPLGIMPTQDIDSLCWPAVRLVWQPVLQNFQTLWGTWVDFYADDRAIHAIYPVHPRTQTGVRLERDLLDHTTATLQAGEWPSSSVQA